MLRALHLTNWKSFGSTGGEIPLGQVTFLLGPNGSGKSNALDALRFLQGAALGYPLGEVLRGTIDTGRRGWPGIRGGDQEARRLGVKSYSVACSFVSPSDTDAAKFTVSVDDEVSRAYQLFDGLGVNMTWAGSHTAEGVAVYLRDLISLLRSTAPGIPPNARAAIALTWLEDFLRVRTHLLEFNPVLMRAYRSMKATSLGDAGENVSAILRGCNPSTLEDIQDWISELCGPSVRGIEFDETKFGEVVFYLNEGEGRKISARSVSDGTLRFLGLATAILTSKEDSLLVLEEPDTGLHPARLGLLAELLQDTAKRRKLQILATTHSSTLLAYLRPEVLGEAVALRRDPETGESRASALAAIPHFETLRDSDRIAELLSTGWLEHAQ